MPSVFVRREASFILRHHSEKKEVRRGKEKKSPPDQSFGDILLLPAPWGEGKEGRERKGLGVVFRRLRGKKEAGGRKKGEIFRARPSFFPLGGGRGKKTAGNTTTGLVITNPFLRDESPGTEKGKRKKKKESEHAVHCEVVSHDCFHGVGGKEKRRGGGEASPAQAFASKLRAQNRAAFSSQSQKKNLSVVPAKRKRPS